MSVEIYRLAGGEEGWSLEVVDHDGGSTIWEDRFATDSDAYAEFYQALETEAIKSFLEQQSIRSYSPEASAGLWKRPEDGNDQASPR